MSQLKTPEPLFLICIIMKIGCLWTTKLKTVKPLLPFCTIYIIFFVHNLDFEPFWHILINLEQSCKSYETINFSFLIFSAKKSIKRVNYHDLNNCKEALDWKENHYVGSISFEVRMPNKNSGIFLSKFQLRSQKLYFVWPWNQKLLWKYVLFFKKKRYWAITLKSCQFVKSHMIPSFTYMHPLYVSFIWVREGT